jgi:hypothetical protein
MQYFVWKMQRFFGLLAALILYSIKVLRFIPVLVDRMISLHEFRVDTLLWTDMGNTGK